MPQNDTQPTLLIIRGLPGSGKSYLASQLQSAIGEDKVVVLDPDKTDYQSQAYLDHVKALTAEGVDSKLYPYRFLRAQAYAAIAAHKIIIWNQPFTNLEIFNKMIANLNLQAAEHNTRLAILIVEVSVDPATAMQRIEQRKQAGGHGPSQNTFGRFVGDYKSFGSDGYTTIAVRGDSEVGMSVATVMQAMQRI